MGYENRQNPVGRRESDFELAAMKLKIDEMTSQHTAMRLRVAQQQTEIDELKRMVHILMEYLM